MTASPNASSAPPRTAQSRAGRSTDPARTPPARRTSGSRCDFATRMRIGIPSSFGRCDSANTTCFCTSRSTSLSRDSESSPAVAASPGRLAEPEHRLLSRLARTLLVARQANQRRPHDRAVGDRRREDRVAPRLARKLRRERQQIVRCLLRRHRSDVGHARTGRAPTSADRRSAAPRSRRRASRARDVRDRSRTRCPTRRRGFDRCRPSCCASCCRG